MIKVSWRQAATSHERADAIRDNVEYSCFFSVCSAVVCASIQTRPSVYVLATFGVFALVALLSSRAVISWSLPFLTSSRALQQIHFISPAPASCPEMCSYSSRFHICPACRRCCMTALVNPRVSEFLVCLYLYITGFAVNGYARVLCAHMWMALAAAAGRPSCAGFFLSGWQMMLSVDVSAESGLRRAGEAMSALPLTPSLPLPPPLL